MIGSAYSYAPPYSLGVAPNMPFGPSSSPLDAPCGMASQNLASLQLFMLMAAIVDSESCGQSQGLCPFQQEPPCEPDADMMPPVQPQGETACPAPTPEPAPQPKPHHHGGGGLFGAIASIGKSAFGAVADGVKGVAHVAGDIAEGTTRLAGKVAQGTVDVGGDVAGGALNLVGLHSAGHDVQHAASVAGSGIDKGFKAVGKFQGQLDRGIGDGAAGLVNGVGSIVTNPIGTAKAVGEIGLHAATFIPGGQLITLGRAAIEGKSFSQVAAGDANFLKNTGQAFVGGFGNEYKKNGVGGVIGDVGFNIAAVVATAGAGAAVDGAAEGGAIAGEAADAAGTAGETAGAAGEAGGWGARFQSAADGVKAQASAAGDWFRSSGASDAWQSAADGFRSHAASAGDWFRSNMNGDAWQSASDGFRTRWNDNMGGFSSAEKEAPAADETAAAGGDAGESGLSDIAMPTTRDEALQTFGLQPGASAQDIAKAYRSLARANHPDLNPDFASQATENMKAINTAKDILNG